MQPLVWLPLLLLFPLLVSSTQYPAGDVAPLNNPDGQLNAGDLIIMQRFVLGDLPQPIGDELLIADVVPDGVLNAGDVVVLTQAVLELITLPDVTIGPAAPVLFPAQSPTNVNPSLITGTAEPNMEIRLNGQPLAVTTADAAGSFQFYAALQEDTNAIYVTAWDGATESDPSNTLNIDFTYEPPTAIHGGPYTAPVNQITWFDGTGSYDKYYNNLTYSWNFGDGSSGTGVTPNHIYTSTGNYTVTLTVTANGVTSVPATTTVTVKDTVVVYPIINSNATLTNDKIYLFFGLGSAPYFGEVILAQLSTLTVEAGTELRFDEDATFVVNGTLKLNGTASNPVIIRGLDGPGFLQRWGGIKLTEYSNATINHAIIEDARDGVEAFYNGTNAVIKNSTFRNNSRAITIHSGLTQALSTKTTVKSNRIHGNDSGMLITGNSRPLVIDGNIIRYNDVGINLAASLLEGNPRPVIYNNAIDHNRFQNYAADFTYPTQQIILDTDDNWWGTTDSVLINRDILDSRDDPQRPTVDLGQIKTLPFDNELVIDPIYEETADNPYMIRGTAPPGTEVNIYAFGADLYLAGTVIANANGRFSFDYTFPEDNYYDFFVRRVDNGKEVEESEWALNGIEYTSNPWWSDIPVINPVSSPTTSNPLPITITSGREFQETHVYVDGALQGLTSQTGGSSLYFETILNVGPNTLTATYLTPTGESAPSAPVVVDYIPEPTLPDYSGGAISGTLVLPPAVSPYQITADILIGQNDKLVLLAGAELDFSGGTRIFADGTLEILGTAANPVHLKSAAPAPAQNDWVGIEVPANANQKTRIEHALIEHAVAGVWFNGGTATVTDSTLQNNFYGVLVKAGTSPILSNNTIQNNSAGIRVNGNATPVIYPHNTITGNIQGIDLVGTGLPGGNPLPRLNENNILGNTDIDLATAAFFDAQNVTLDTKGNWWGTTDTNTIDSNIHDGNDSPADAPLVDYLPVQPAVLTTASPLTPSLQITVLNTNTPAYTVNGTAEPNREVHLYLNGLLEATLTSDAAGDFSQAVILVAGTNTLYAIAVNGAEQSLPYLTYTVGNDTTPPEITLTTPVEAALVNYATFIGQLDEAATLTVDGEAATVNPDNSFSHNLSGLLQGLNAIELIATDLAGNSSTLNVTFTLDSQPPAIPDTAQITVGTPSGGLVTISAPATSATAGDMVTLTNTRTGESVQTTVLGDGSYAADIGAQAGDEIVILINDPAGNATASRILQVAGTAPTLGLTVTTPLDGSTVNDDQVGVSGTFQGPANVGITVNGATAQTIGNTFCAGNILLDTGANQVEVTATTPDGTTTTQSLTVTSTGSSLVELEADAETGFAPHTVTFSLMDNTGATLTTIEYDIDNDGTPDYTISNPTASIQHTYTVPGCYTATVTATDTASNNYTASQTIATQDLAGLDGHLRGIFYRMLSNLRNGNITSAMESLTDTMRTKYESQFNTLGTADLVTLVNSLGTVEGGGVAGNVAEYVIVREEGGSLRAFTLYFIHDSDGLWRLAEM